MFKITSGTVMDLAQLERDRFYRDMVALVRELSPQQAALIGADTEIKAAISSSMDRAIALGGAQRDTLQLFVELSLQMGIGFTDDPLLGLEEVIPKVQGVSEVYWREQLFQRAVLLMDRIAAPDWAPFDAALARFQAMPPDAQTDPFRAVRSLYPQKADDVSDAMLQNVRARLDEVAVAHHAPEARDMLFYLGVVFGHRCYEDPYLPWIGEALRADDAGGALRDGLSTWSRAYLTIAP